MPTLYFTVLFVIAVVAMVGTKLWLAVRQTRDWRDVPAAVCCAGDPHTTRRA